MAYETDLPANQAADETDPSRARSTAAIRVLDPTQPSTQQLVPLYGSSTLGLRVNVTGWGQGASTSLGVVTLDTASQDSGREQLGEIQRLLALVLVQLGGDPADVAAGVFA